MKIVGMMPVYNEADIVAQSVAYLISQGIELVILDSSTDGSYEIVSKFLGKGVISIKKFHSDKFEQEKILSKLCQMAESQTPDWEVICDADEFLESPRRELTLKQAIELEDARGYNIIQFNNFEFMLTERDLHAKERDIRKRLRYYTWNDDFRFRAFKFYPGTRIHEHGGHFPIFQILHEVNISPNKFVLRHYRFRSYEQGLRKVFEERLPRYSPHELNKGWHVHYKNFRKDKRYFVIDPKRLNRYEEDGNWNYVKTFDVSFRAWTAEGPVSEITVLHRRVDEKSAKIVQLQRELDKRTEWTNRILGSGSTLSYWALAYAELFSIYNARQDLKTAYPEAALGDHKNLIAWAARVALGQDQDGDANRLEKFAYLYASAASPVELENLKGEVALRAEQLSAARSDLDNFRQKLKDLTGELSLKSAEIDGLRTGLQAKSDEVERLKEQLSAKSNDTARLEQELRVTQSRLESGASDIDTLRIILTKTLTELEELKRNFGYKFIRFYATRIDRMFPDGSRRGKLRKILVRSVGITSEQGLGSLLRQISEKLRKREFNAVEPWADLDEETDIQTSSTN